MNNNLNKSYEATAVQKSFIHQIGLKKNKDYENWADEVAKELIQYFYSEYKGIKIEIPKLRIKSDKSLLGKIKNLQIERLSKLYAIEGIPDEEKDELYLLIEERIYENDELDSTNILEKIKEIIYGEFKPENLDEIENTIMVDGISKSTKTALLRILVTKIVKSTLPVNYRKEKFKYFEIKYGEIAAKRTGLPENNILKLDSVINIKNDKRKLERLRSETKFLKANDLRGMKIVVVDMPGDMKTENTEIENILQKRNYVEDDKDRALYTRLEIVEIGKDFFAKIEQNEELLKKLHMQVIPCSSKHKKKGNGYEAEHIKFINTDNPEFTLELQLKSEYVENICRGDGKASHENRPGKARVLPEAKTNEELVAKLKYLVPSYKTFIRNGEEIEIQEYDMLKNVMSYFQEQISPESEEYEKIIEVLSNTELEKEIGQK